MEREQDAYSRPALECERIQAGAKTEKQRTPIVKLREGKKIIEELRRISGVDSLSKPAGFPTQKKSGSHLQTHREAGRGRVRGRQSVRNLKCQKMSQAQRELGEQQLGENHGQGEKSSRTPFWPQLPELRM